MKYKLIIAFLFFVVMCFSQPITVNTTNYTTPQLITNVLINKPCISVSNIKWQTGINFRSSNGIGYFENSNPQFPIAKGVILSTGDVLNAPGPNTSELSDGNSNWIGDKELENTLFKSGISIKSTNATFVEFEFVALSPYLNFPFVFASEEYGKFQCQFSDSFVFLLTDTSTGLTTNLAVVPNTSVPISVTTIRDFLYNSSCLSVNEQYFNRFNGGSNAASAAINFNGQTVQLTASTDKLVPNRTYKIKIVIADRFDHQFDSALFLRADSFNIGQNVLGPDLTIANASAVCANSTTTLTSGLDPSLYSFSWTKNGNPLRSNTPNLRVNTPGLYGLTYTIIASNCPVATDTITVEYYPELIAQEPNDLTKCNQGLASYTFDLSLNNSLLQNVDFKANYFNKLIDASNNDNVLAPNHIVAAANLPTRIYARIENVKTGCFTVKSFLLQLVQNPIANKSANSNSCETSSGSKIGVFNISAVSSSVLGVQSPLIYDVSVHSNPIDANASLQPINSSLPFSSASTTLYARIQVKGEPSCYNLTSFNLTVDSKPDLDQINDQFVCDNYILPTLVNPGSYFSGPNKGLPQLNAGDSITSDRTIYIFGASSSNPSCTSERSFTIKFVKSVDLNKNNEDFCDKFTVPSNFPFLRFFTLPGGPTGGGTEFLPGSVISTAGPTVLYTYFKSTDTLNSCILEGRFDITIFKTPQINPIPNVFACGSYDLPPLSVGGYYTFDPRTGIYSPILSSIITTTTIYVFATSGRCRTPDIQFNVYIGTFGFQNYSDCNPYNLAPVPVGEYRNAPNGGGSVILPGLINETTTVYAHISGISCDAGSFTITILKPYLSQPSTKNECESYLLPAQTEGAKYYRFSGGTTTVGNEELAIGQEITTTKTIFIHKSSQVLNGCYNEIPWLITIKKPIIDSRASVENCTSYILTPLKNGRYFDDKNGQNPLAENTLITKTNKIYIYDVNPIDPTCFSENEFDITISNVQVQPPPSQLSYCDTFTFPPLSPQNFYYDAPDGPFGLGSRIPAGTTINAAALLPKYYIFSETENRLNCTAERSFQIIVTPKPVANLVQPIETCDTFMANDGIFQFDLTDPLLTNQVLGTQTPVNNFTITFYNSESNANDIAAIPISNPSQYKNQKAYAESIWIRITNNKSAVPCFDVVELKLIINPKPEPKLKAEYFICNDHTTSNDLNSVTLDSEILDTNYLFEWTLQGLPFGGNFSSITTSQPGNYELKVTNTTTLCSVNSKSKVTFYSPYLEITYSNAFENPNFVTVNVLGTNSGNYEYKIDDLEFQDSSMFENVVAGEHTIYARDKTGSCDPLPLKVILINYPKFFTPNGDGYNDTWNISHLKSNNPNAQISIFDRYGKLLKEISPASEGWNGLFNGQPLPSTDYWFTVNFVENGTLKTFKSHFALKR